jgi:hypothetical protein
MPPSPHQSAAQTITKLIEAQYTIERELRQHLEFNTGNLVTGLSLAVTLQDANPESLNGFQITLRSYFLSDASSFKRMKVRQLLDDLLAADSHVSACCQTPWGLARAIEVLSPIAIRSSGLSWDEGGQEIAVPRMLSILYETDYQRETYVHLYNFVSEQLPLPISVFHAEIVGLSVTDLPRLIGEVTFTSVLHDPKTGACFTRFVDKGEEADNVNFQACWAATSTIVQILRFFKCGIIDLDYGAIYYRPVWVNEIRWSGIRTWGLPRRDAQKELYMLSNQELQRFVSYCKVYEKLKPLIEETSTSLRQATALAGNYFEDHHKRIKPEEKLIDLVIALETLFSPSRESELRFRIAQRAAILLGKTAPERESIRDFILRVYDARSGLVHAGESPFSTAARKKLSDEDLVHLADYVRQAVLRFFLLRWRGESEKEKVQTLLDKCALDGLSLGELHSKSDFEAAISEILAS